VGNSEFVGDGVFELKLNIGPGYRLYFANVDDVIIVICTAAPNGDNAPT